MWRDTELKKRRRKRKEAAAERKQEWQATSSSHDRVADESPPGFAASAHETRCWVSHNGSVLLWRKSQELLHLQSGTPRSRKDQWRTFPEIESQGLSHKVNGASLPELWPWTGHLSPNGTLAPGTLEESLEKCLCKGVSVWPGLAYWKTMYNESLNMAQTANFNESAGAY